MSFLKSVAFILISVFFVTSTDAHHINLADLVQTVEKSIVIVQAVPNEQPKPIKNN